MDPAALAAMFGGSGGLSREQAAMFTQMMGGAAAAGGMQPQIPAPPSGDRRAAMPAPPGGAVNPEDLGEEDKEKFIQEYAAYLDKLKETHPQEYQEIMNELAASVQQAKKGFEPVMPGGEKKLGAEGIGKVAEEEGIEVTPKPGFVIKTTATANNNKIFINVCQSEHIKTFSKKKKLQPDGTEQEGINIPLSLGPPQPLTTNKGEKVLVFDCIVNPEVLSDSKADRTGSFRHFLCELCIQYVETKYKTALDHKYKLPRSAYKGTIRSQRIRKQTAPKIEEVEEPTPAAASKSTKRNAAPKTTRGSTGPAIPKKKSSVIKVKTPKEHARHAVLCLLEGETEPRPWVATIDVADVAALVIHVQLDQAPADALPVVELAEELLSLKCKGYFALEVYLPVAVNEAGDVKVAFTRSSGLLEITAPKKQLRTGIHAGPDPGSKPWLLAQALGTNMDGSSEDHGDDTGSAPRVEEQTYQHPNPHGPVDEDEELPEDRFHKADMVSNHILMERAKERAKSRKTQAEKERVQEAEKAKQEAEEAAKRLAEEEAARAAAIEAIGKKDTDTGEGDLVLTSSIAMDLLD